MRWLIAAAVTSFAFQVSVPPTFGACVNTKCSNLAIIEQARQMIQSSCGCTRSGQTHGKYQKCVKGALKAADLTALIPQKTCRKLIMKCENASICGKPNGAVCCSLNKHNQVKASIVGSASKCKKGSACARCWGSTASSTPAPPTAHVRARRPRRLSRPPRRPRLHRRRPPWRHRAARSSTTTAPTTTTDCMTSEPGSSG